MTIRHVLLAASLSLLAASATGQSPCEVMEWQGSFLVGSKLGYSVDLDGDRMAIGQPYGFAEASTVEPGMVHLYRRESHGWEFDGLVQASDGAEYDDFGYSVALDGDRLLVGARAIGYLGAKGAAYVFERQGDAVWVETAKLLPDEPQAFAIGWSVDLEGDRAVIGAKGASIGLGWGRVFVYEHVGGQWVMQQQLLPSFSKVGDAFGIAVALEGDRLVVGASYGYTAIHPNPGWTFVFENQGGTWMETAVLTGADSADDDGFGCSVALAADTIVVGARGHDDPNPAGGAVYVFEHADGVWSQRDKLFGTPSLGSQFGRSVDLEVPRLVIGARNSEVVFGGGVAYLFELEAGTWDLVTKFWGSKLAAGDTFSDSLDLEGDEILVGAANTYSSYSSPGSAYLFSLQPGPHVAADAAVVSLSQGGTQTLHVGGCPAHAGELYFVAGSATGTVPGFLAFGLAVPLNPDVYFLHTVNNPGGPPLTGAFGLLDAFGCADVRFELPPGTSPALAGVVLHHAYALLDGATLQMVAVSAAVPVTLVP